MNTTTEDMLAKLGLQPRMSMRDYLLPALGVFGLGMLAGAGITLFAMPGVRRQLRDRLRRGAAKVQEAAEEITDEAEERRVGKGKITDLPGNGKGHPSAAGEVSH